MSNYDVIHKSGSTLYVTPPPEQDRATAIDNTHKKFAEDWMCTSEDMIVDRHTYRHTQTGRQTDTLITILRFPTGGKVMNSRGDTLTTLHW